MYIHILYSVCIQLCTYLIFSVYTAMYISYIQCVYSYVHILYSVCIQLCTYLVFSVYTAMYIYLYIIIQRMYVFLFVCLFRLIVCEYNVHKVTCHDSVESCKKVQKATQSLFQRKRKFILLYVLCTLYVNRAYVDWIMCIVRWFCMHALSFVL